jgi:hypothetical protein
MLLNMALILNQRQNTAHALPIAVVSRQPSVRRPTPAASMFAAASPGAAMVGWEASFPRTVLAPTRQSTRTLRDEAAQRRLLLRWGAQGMRQFAPSHLQPLALSPMRLVLPVRKVGALPSLPHTRRFAAAHAFCWRPRRVAPVEAPAQVRASRGNTSACVLGRGSVASVARPLLLGRLARVAFIRRVSLSARQGHRIASADSCATRVVCGGGGFASRLPGARSGLVWARLQPKSPVSLSAPNPSVNRTLRDEAAQRR